RCLEFEQAAHARAQHQPVVGLGKKIVAASFDPAYTIAGVVERCDEDHRNPRCARISLDAPTHFKPRRAVVDAEIPGRHRDIENAKIRMLLEGGSDRRRTIRSRYRLVAEAVKLVE